MEMPFVVVDMLWDCCITMNKTKLKQRGFYKYFITICELISIFWFGYFESEITFYWNGTCNFQIKKLVPTYSWNIAYHVIFLSDDWISQKKSLSWYVLWFNRQPF